jgi:hypothetical protein
MRFNRLAVASTALACSLLVACDGPTAVQPGDRSSPANPGRPLETPDAAGAKVDQTIRARFSWADEINIGTVAAPESVPAAIRGDDRLRDGSPSAPVGPSNEYQGNFCGVNAVIGDQLFVDPQRYWSASLPASCQPTRYYRYYLNGPSQAPSVVHPQSIVEDIGTMAVGETHIQPFKSGTAHELGFGLWFDDAYPPASSVLITRLPNVIDELGRSVRQWRVETRGAHKAVKVVANTGNKPGQTATSTFYYLPWALTITEVPYPFPTYP